MPGRKAGRDRKGPPLPGGAAALYVWNIIDGIVAKGKKQIVIGDARLGFAPFATDQAGGIALNLKF